MTDRTVGAAGAAGTFDYTCDGVNDHSQITAAIVAAGAGSTVHLSAGVFTCAADIYIDEGRSLVGTAGTVLQFDETTPRHLTAKGQNAVDRLELRGGIVLTVAGSDVVVSNVTSYQHLYGVGAFQIYPWSNPVSNILFTDCSAIGTSGFGFIIDAPTYAYVVKDVTFTRCHARNCGASNDLIEPAESKDWVTGFDVAEKATLINAHLVDCTAEGSWESGFHSEYGPVTNCSMTRCVSRDNAKIKPSPTFAAGFTSPPSWTFTDCISINNKLGFRHGNLPSGPHTGELLSFVRCQASGALVGIDVGMVAGYPYRITAENCSIADGVGSAYSIHLDGVTGARFTDTVVVNCAGGVYETGPCSDNIITYHLAPFRASVAAPVTGEAVAFTETSENDGLTAWTWDFGDGTTSAAQNPVHAYTAPGEYTVTLTAGGNTVVETVHVQYPINPHSRVMRQQIGRANKYPRVI